MHVRSLFSVKRLNIFLSLLHLNLSHTVSFKCIQRVKLGWMGIDHALYVVFKLKCVSAAVPDCVCIC